MTYIAPVNNKLIYIGLSNTNTKNSKVSYNNVEIKKDEEVFPDNATIHRRNLSTDLTLTSTRIKIPKETAILDSGAAGHF